MVICSVRDLSFLEMPFKNTYGSAITEFFFDDLFYGFDGFDRRLREETI